MEEMFSNKILIILLVYYDQLTNILYKCNIKYIIIYFQHIISILKKKYLFMIN